VWLAAAKRLNSLLFFFQYTANPVPKGYWVAFYRNCIRFAGLSYRTCYISLSYIGVAYQNKGGRFFFAGRKRKKELKAFYTLTRLQPRRYDREGSSRKCLSNYGDD
ncbi:hypothetical protein ACFQ2Z_23750, partial [Paenibacillus timonensis]